MTSWEKQKDDYKDGVIDAEIAGVETIRWLHREGAITSFQRDTAIDLFCEKIGGLRQRDPSDA